MARELVGLPYAGTPADLNWYTNEALTKVAGDWFRFELTLPKPFRGLLAVNGTDPETRSERRADALVKLGETLRAQSTADMALVEAGDLTLNDWRERLHIASSQWSLAAAQVGFGSPLAQDYLTASRLTSLRDNLGTRLAALQERVEAGEISHAQAQAWAGQAAAGAMTTAGAMGAAERLAGQAVRRVMSAGEDHCSTCPPKAKTYPWGVEQCVSECGGWPGDGSDQCHGNCLCRIISAHEYSVYGDRTTEILRQQNLVYQGPSLEELAGNPTKQAMPATRQEVARRHVENVARLNAASAEYEAAVKAKRGTQTAAAKRAKAISAVLATAQMLREAGILWDEVMGLAQGPPPTG